MADEEQDVKTGVETAAEESSTQKESEGAADQQGKTELPDEAKAAASATTKTGAEDDDRIPKSRLDEVIAQREEERQARARLEGELRALRDQVNSQGKAKTWEDLSVEELERVRAYYEEQNDEKQVRFVDRMLIKREAVNEVRKEMETRQRDQTKVAAWQHSLQHSQEMVKRFNDKSFDLNDPDSAVRKMTAQILSAEPDLQQHPKGPSAAYEVALGRMLLERSTTGQVIRKAMKTGTGSSDGQLAGGGQTKPTASSLERQESEAFNEPDPRVRERKISVYLGNLEKSRKATVTT